MFCAAATTINKCKTEGVIDVFQVLKSQRIQKPGSVQTVVSIMIYAIFIFDLNKIVLKFYFCMVFSSKINTVLFLATISRDISDCTDLLRFI